MAMVWGMRPKCQQWQQEQGQEQQQQQQQQQQQRQHHWLSKTSDGCCSARQATARLAQQIAHRCRFLLVVRRRESSTACCHHHYLCALAAIASQRASEPTPSAPQSFLPALRTRHAAAARDATGVSGVAGGIRLGHRLRLGPVARFRVRVRLGSTAGTETRTVMGCAPHRMGDANRRPGSDRGPVETTTGDATVAGKPGVTGVTGVTGSPTYPASASYRRRQPHGPNP